MKAEAILLPIYGYIVPFHISTVKNASKTDEYLRINFVTPTQVVAQFQVNSPSSPFSRASFFLFFFYLICKLSFILLIYLFFLLQTGGKEVLYIREVTYRIQDQRSLTNSLRLIKELRKRVTERETELRDKRGLITQEKLIISKNRNPRLMDLFIRPSIPSLALPSFLSFSPRLFLVLSSLQ